MTELDPERQKKAKEYARLRRRLFVLDLGLAGLYTLAFLLSGISPALKGVILETTPEPNLAAVLYFWVFALGYGTVQLPLAYYGGFILPHRYGLSTQTLSGWVKDQVKGGFLGLVLGTVAIEAVYFSLRFSPAWWWLISGLFLLFFTTIMAIITPLVILPLFWRLTPIPDPDLVRRLESLAERAGTRVRGVFTIDLSQRTTAANAALMGLGNTRRIVLGDTLYRDYTPDEIETILAHELGHHVNGDIPRGILMQSLLTLGGLWLADLALKWGVAFFGFEGIDDLAAFPLLALALGGFMVLTIPLGNTYSRWRERAADDYALKTTSKPAAFISAMTKLANQNLADADPEPWMEFLLFSHPSIKRRLEHGKKFLRQIAKSPNSLQNT